MISREQAATEQHLHEQIERKDANVLADYAEYVADNLSDGLLRNFFFAMLMTDDLIWNFMLGQVRGHSRLVHASLDDLARDLERLRAGFMADTAAAMLKEAQGEQA